MEQLNTYAAQQEELGKQLKTILTNAKKDPSIRKTEDYIESRLSKVENIWTKIQENHTKMSAFGVKHNYFDQKYIDQLQKLYEDTKSYLNECKKPEKEETRNGDPVQEARLKKQEFKIEQMLKEIEKVHNELQQDQQKWKYEVLLKKLTKLWEVIYDLNEEISLNEKRFEVDYFANDTYANAEEKFEAVVHLLQTKIFNLPENTSPTKIPLQPVKLPVFNGKYEEWPAFHDIFQKLVHDNPSLSKIEKIQHLKTHIKDEPRRMTQHLQISEANYDAVWSLLKKRYDNTKLIFGKLVDRLLDSPVLQRGSAEELKELYDISRESLEGIKNLDVDTTTWGPLVSRIISRKWDSETNRIYQQSRKNPHEIPDFEEMMDFLQTRFQSLEEQPENKKKFNASWMTKPSFKDQNCKYCKDSHNINNCDKFKALPVHKRIQWVKEKKLCLNCMNMSHSTIDCLSKQTCRTCNKKHHSLLHKELQKEQSRSTAFNQKRTTTSSNVATQSQNVLIATALVQVTTSSGTTELLRALVDPGSQASFVTEHAAQIIGKPRFKVHAEVNGVGDASPKVAKWKINAQISPRFPSSYRMNVEFLVLPKLTQQMPQQQLNADTEEWKHCLLADPTYHTPGPIDVILGVEEYGNIILPEMQKV